MVPKQQQRQLMNQNKRNTGRRKKKKQKKQEERSSQSCMQESVGETGNRSPGEMGLPPQSSKGRGVFASRRVIHLASGLEWEPPGWEPGPGEQLGDADHCFQPAKPLCREQLGASTGDTVQTSSQGQWGVGGMLLRCQEMAVHKARSSSPP